MSIRNIILNGDPDSYLSLSDFNDFCRWLTAGGFDDSSFSMSDTRRELIDKLIGIFNQ